MVVTCMRMAISCSVKTKNMRNILTSLPDVGECLGSDSCSQLCVAGVEGSECQCRSGYRLSNDRTSCFPDEGGFWAPPQGELLSVRVHRFRILVLSNCRTCMKT